MTKRAAMLMAAGLVAALAAGAMALSFGLAGNGTAQAETKDPKPIVRTIHRTVTVEKPAKATDKPVQVIQLASAPASSTGSSDGSDDALEQQEGSDDAYESEDHAEDHEDDGYADHEVESSDD